MALARASQKDSNSSRRFRLVTSGQLRSPCGLRVPPCVSAACGQRSDAAQVAPVELPVAGGFLLSEEVSKCGAARLLDVPEHQQRTAACQDALRGTQARKQSSERTPAVRLRQLEHHPKREPQRIASTRKQAGAATSFVATSTSPRLALAAAVVQTRRVALPRHCSRDSCSERTQSHRARVVPDDTLTLAPAPALAPAHGMSGRGRGRGAGSGRGRGRGPGLGRGSVETGATAAHPRGALFAASHARACARRRLWQPCAPAARRPAAAGRVLRARAERRDRFPAGPSSVEGACARHRQLGARTSDVLLRARVGRFVLQPASSTDCGAGHVVCRAAAASRRGTKRSGSAAPCCAYAGRCALVS